jgi:hypothetical protein
LWLECNRTGRESEDAFNGADLLSDIALCQPSNFSFADHVHCFIALDSTLCRGERAKAEARIDPRFDRTVILFDNIVEIRDHASATSLAECMIPVQFVNNIAICQTTVASEVRRSLSGYVAEAYASAAAATAWKMPAVSSRRP